MNAKYYFYILIALCLIACGWFLNDNLTEKNIEVKPQYGDIVIHQDSIYRPIINILQMPKHTIDVVNIYLDSDSNEHQVYLDTLNIEQDSLSLSLIASVDVNIEKRIADFSYKDILVKSFEIVKTITKEIPIHITEYKPNPFYKNHWFYAWLGTASLVVLMIMSLIQ